MNRLRTNGLVEQGRFEDETIYRITRAGKEACRALNKEIKRVRTLTLLFSFQVARPVLLRRASLNVAVPALLPTVR